MNDITTQTTITIQLSSDDMEALEKSAAKDLRLPAQQAIFMIRQELRRRGFLLLGQDTQSEEVEQALIAALVRRGVSANKIVALIGGTREVVLRKIRNEQMAQAETA